MPFGIGNNETIIMVLKRGINGNNEMFDIFSFLVKACFFLAVAFQVEKLVGRCATI